MKLKAYGIPCLLCQLMSNTFCIMIHFGGFKPLKPFCFVLRA